MTFSILSALRAYSRPLQPIGWGVGVVSRIRGWTVDRQREARIRDLRQRMHAAHAAGDKAALTTLGRAMFAECDARSPAQIARMEKRLLDSLDPHARAIFDRARAR